ncbi:MAG: copper amine oxidase N-terminal domain-containing protein [Clostridia bacterium]|nr:copper amine oxidase N-terminal domain-containing protein [Clostridia bacterium]
MKNIKRILAAILALSIIGTSAVFAEETATAESASRETTEKAEFDIPEKVEISFKVGDDTLIINGESVKVETAPYVVGEGTTLVPVRVITEAFGARVGWDGETRTVTLDYPDVNIVLQIGNPVAEVNGEAVTLLAAPELPDGRTMVPLRFISETFGADVGYDEETRGITVTKEAAEEGTTVEGVIETAYIGDSYYGWSMLNPKNLRMEVRSFDGTETEFSDEEDENYITIDIYKLDDDYDIEKDFKSGKEFYQSVATLVKAEKNTDDKKCRTFRIEARTTERYYCDIIFVTEAYKYCVCFAVDNKEESKKEFFELAESFKLEFGGEDIHDLSNLENGMRKFESEEMNFTLLLPATMTGGADKLKVNQFKFYSSAAKKFNIGIEIISKSEATKTPVGYVESDKEMSENGMNTSIMRFGDLTKTTYGEADMFEYRVSVSGSHSGDRLGRMMSFELGEYIYIITMLIDAAYDTAPEAVLDSFVANMKFNEIDPEKAGILMDSSEEPEDKADKEIECGSAVFTAPYYYEDMESNGLYMIIDEDREIGIIVMSQAAPPYMSLSEMADSLKSSVINSIKKKDDQKITSTSPKKTQVGKTVFYKFTYELTGKETYSYTEVYVCEIDGILYIMLADIPEFFKSDETIKEVNSIVTSIKKK